MWSRAQHGAGEDVSTGDRFVNDDGAFRDHRIEQYAEAVERDRAGGQRGVVCGLVNQRRSIARAEGITSSRVGSRPSFLARSRWWWQT